MEEDQELLLSDKMGDLSLFGENMKDLFPGERKRDWILVEEIQTTGLPHEYCRLCFNSTSVPYYTTKEEEKEWRQIAHKACGDLPMEMEHRQLHHPGHTLRKTNGADDGSSRFCNSCNDYKCLWNVYYKCSDCESFLLGIKCALKLFPINHKCHPHHPLIPIHNREEFHCDACSMVHQDDISYECTTCDPSFRVRQYCVSPRIIRLPSHRHDVRFVYSLPETHFGEPIYCHICRQDMKGGQSRLAYHCARCRFYFHIHDCRTVQHPSLDFPMLPVEEEGGGAEFDSNRSLRCLGCHLKISVPYYLGTNSFSRTVLHKFCFELPKSVEHHMHPGHDLRLGKYKCMCDACDAPWEGFSYICPRGSCSFSIDIICALKSVASRHKFHKHPLIASHTKGPLACRACNKDSDGPSYKCTTCRFWVHYQCGSAPMSRKHDMHPHLLKLTYSIRDSTEDSGRKFHCHVCREEMKPHDWAYYCAGCKYYIHTHDCYDPPWSSELEEFDHEAALAIAVRLPAVDSESVSLATLVFMDTNKEEDGELKPDTKEADGRKMGQTLLYHDLYETCHMCEKLIAAPCNNCALCKYFLPKSIAEFNDPDSLLRGYYSMLKASAIETNCNGFGMSFFEDGSTKIKISSSVLPRYVKHEGHRHVLLTTFIIKPTWCSACEGDFQGYAFRCNLCNFTIDTYCASLPGSIRHGYDKKHPFKLTYYSIEGVEEYVCELCEGDITTMWFYHCVECDQSIHPTCIWKYFSFFGDSVLVRDHVVQTFLVPTTKTHAFGCFVCDQNETTGCCYSAFQLGVGSYMTTHLECGGDSMIKRWPAEREELANLLALMKRMDLYPPDIFER